jgi:hypothetical protein
MDYYEGRNDPDATPWLSYFLRTMATAAGGVRDRALELHEAVPRPRAPWEELSRRQQQLLSRLVVVDPDGKGVATFTPGDIADWFMVSAQTARAGLRQWHDAGFVAPAGGRQRIRVWVLNEEFSALVGRVRSAGQTHRIA